MSISLEPVTAVLRYHPSGGFGDAFTFSCVLLRYGDEALLMAASGAFTATVDREIREMLRVSGVRTIRYQRLRCGVSRDKVIRL